MNEAWGAVVAAIAAGVFGIIGILAGIYVGRRQTVDQTAVEHGQWLRGQRQKAFADYLSAWDHALDQCQEVSRNIDEHTRPENYDPHRYEQEVSEHINALLSDAINSVRKPFEQLQLLLPEDIVESANRADWALMETVSRLGTWSVCAFEADVIQDCINQYGNALGAALDARRVLFRAARRVLLSHPRPNGL